MLMFSFHPFLVFFHPKDNKNVWNVKTLEKEQNVSMRSIGLYYYYTITKKETNTTRTKTPPNSIHKPEFHEKLPFHGSSSVITTRVSPSPFLSGPYHYVPPNKVIPKKNIKIEKKKIIWAPKSKRILEKSCAQHRRACRVCAISAVYGCGSHVGSISHGQLRSHRRHNHVCAQQNSILNQLSSTQLTNSNEKVQA